MKANVLTRILVGIAFIFLIPIIIYFITFWGKISTDHNDWIAFGGLAYGFAIVFLTAVNIGVILRVETQNQKLTAMLANIQMDRNKAEKLSELLLEFRQLRIDNFNWNLEGIKYNFIIYYLIELNDFKEAKLLYFQSDKVKVSLENQISCLEYMRDELTKVLQDKPNQEKVKDFSIKNLYEIGEIDERMFKSLKNIYNREKNLYESVNEEMRQEIQQKFHS